MLKDAAKFPYNLAYTTVPSAKSILPEQVIDGKSPAGQENQLLNTARAVELTERRQAFRRLLRPDGRQHSINSFSIGCESKSPLERGYLNYSMSLERARGPGW